MSNLCQLRFNVRVNTNYKESVRIVGDKIELGNWNPYKGLELTTNSDKYPIWYLENPLWFPKGTRFEFKIVIFENYHVKRWESLPDNGNRKYRIRFYSVTLECAEGDISGREIIHKKFSSTINFDQPKCLEAKKRNDKKFFNPFDLAGSDDSDPESDFSSSLFSSGSSQGEESPNIEKFLRHTVPMKTSFYSPAFDRKNILNIIDDSSTTENKLNEIYQNIRSRRHNIMWHKSTKFQIHIPNYPIEYVLPGSIENFEEYITFLTFDIPFEIKKDTTSSSANFNTSFKIMKTNVNSMYDSLCHQIKANLRWITYTNPSIMKEYARIKDKLLEECYYMPIEMNLSHFKKMDQWVKSIFESYNNIIQIEMNNNTNDYEYYVKLKKEIREITYDYTINLSKNIIEQNIIINDIRLIFAAEYLNKINLTVSICFICEFSFPNYEVFKYLIYGREIIDALLFYNIIYFENMDDMSYFVEICMQYYNTIQPISKKYCILLQIFGRTIILNTKKLMKNRYHSHHPHQAHHLVFNSQDNMNVHNHHGHHLYLSHFHYRHHHEFNSNEYIIHTKNSDQVTKDESNNDNHTSVLTVKNMDNITNLSNNNTDNTNIKKPVTSISKKSSKNNMDSTSRKPSDTNEKVLNFESLFSDIIKDFHYSAKLYEYSYVILSNYEGREVLMALPKKMKRLNTLDLCKDYDASFNRVFIFSLGVLINRKEMKKFQAIDENDHNLQFIQQKIINSINNEFLSTLRKIASNDENTVYIITRFSKALMTLCCDNSENINLIAENGYYYKNPPNDTWSTITNKSMDWLTDAQNIMRKYLNRIENSTIRRYDSYVVFKIKGSDPIIKKSLIQSLEMELKTLFLANEHVEIIKTTSKVIARFVGLNKGTLTQILLQKVFQDKEKIDFLFIYGESVDDEEIFAGAKRSTRYCQEIFPEGLKPIYCIQGQRPSEADYYIENNESLLYILNKAILDQAINY